jgi:hypothetical protein
MRISSGMAEINFNRLSADKIYVWPQYNAGRVGYIHRISNRNELVGTYYKPSADERERILELVNNPVRNQYSPSGSLSRSLSEIRPGMLFDAIA